MAPCSLPRVLAGREAGVGPGSESALPVPPFDVAFHHQHESVQPCLPDEQAAPGTFVEAGGGLVVGVAAPGGRRRFRR